MKPCPFCGSDDLRDQIDFNGSTRVQCASCGAIGPHGVSWESREPDSLLVAAVLNALFWNVEVPSARSTHEDDIARRLKELLALCNIHVEWDTKTKEFNAT